MVDVRLTFLDTLVAMPSSGSIQQFRSIFPKGEYGDLIYQAFFGAFIAFFKFMWYVGGPYTILIIVTSIFFHAQFDFILGFAPIGYLLISIFIGMEIYAGYKILKPLGQKAWRAGLLVSAFHLVLILPIMFIADKNGVFIKTLLSGDWKGVLEYSVLGVVFGILTFIGGLSATIEAWLQSLKRGAV